MKFIVIFTRHVDMLNFLRPLAVILVIMLTDVSTGSKPTSEIKLEGSLSEHDVIIGSNVNLTCTAHWSPKASCAIMWIKNSKRLDEKVKDGRTQWLLGKQTNYMRRCSVAKFMIRNFSSSDAGKYECLSINYITSQQAAPKENAVIQIHAVTCYQGFYCSEKETKSEPKRCPTGTFSPYKNATSVKDCLPCPTDTNERENWKSKMEPKIVAIFQTNCHSKSLIQGKTSNLSSGAKVAIIVFPIIATLALVMAVLYAFRRRKAMVKYSEKLFNSFKDVDYDAVKVPRSKDVFVCYSSVNRHWVHNILFPNLKSQDFKVFIDFIDFEIGKTIDDNIIKGIYGSRKTLFILSKDSLKSLYARKELYHALAAGKTGHQVLVILYEKCKTPAEISNIVYLDWTDEKNRDRFWERLYSAIRRPLANEIVDV